MIILMETMAMMNYTVMKEMIFLMEEEELTFVMETPEIIE